MHIKFYWYSFLPELTHCSCHYQALEDLSLQYDSSVRNSESTVVQFTYGDDSLHPEKMENNNRPVDFERLRVHISQTSPCPEETALRPQELKDAVENHLADEHFQSLPSTGAPFLQEIRDYYGDMAKKQKELMEIDGIEDDDVDRVTWNSCRITTTQLKLALEKALSIYTAAAAEPGEAVGAMGAQSISEPGTQMTLKVSNMIYSRFDLCFYIVLYLSCHCCTEHLDVSLCWCFFNECDPWCTATQGDYQCIQGHIYAHHYSKTRARREQSRCPSCQSRDRKDYIGRDFELCEGSIFCWRVLHDD